jgi:hypothetical protein
MRSLLSCALRAASVLVVLASTTLAAADIPPPNSAQCNGKNAGDACKTDDGKEGSCKTTTCSRFGPLPDGAIGSIEYACTLCAVGTTPAPTTTGTSTTAPTTDGGGGGSSSNCGVAPARERHTTNDGAWLLVALVPAALVVSRGRRR